MFPMDYRKPSMIGREAAIISVAQRGNERDAESVVRDLNITVSKSSLNRALTTGHDQNRKPNEQIVAFAVDEFSRELALENGYPRTEEDIDDARAWFALNHIDARTVSATDDDPVWIEDEELARTIIDSPLRDRPLSQVIHASARLHLSRNPTLDPSTRATARAEALKLLESFIDAHADHYRSLSLDALVGAESNTLPETDFSGVLFSIALNLLVLARGGDTDAEWEAFLKSLETEGLLAQLAVRGVFFSEPKTLANTAEVCWVLGRLEDARLLLEKAAVLHTDLDLWIDEVGRTFYEDGFVKFALDKAA